MRQSFSAALITAVLVAGLATAPSAEAGSHWFSGVAGSGHPQTEQRNLTGFDSIELGCSADIEVVAGNDFSVSVTADDNILPLIETEVRGNKLVIDSHARYSTHDREKVVVHLPALKGLSLSGSGDATVSGLAGNDVAFSISGSGDLTATGSAGKVNASIEGSGDMALDRLDASEARIRIDGSGDARVAVRDALDVEVNGSGDVSYRGNPQKLRQVVNGSGSVSRI